MLRSEGNMSLKNPVTPPGIDPGTVRLVAQHPNHYATPDPRFIYIYIYIYMINLSVDCLSFRLLAKNNGKCETAVPLPKGLLSYLLLQTRRNSQRILAVRINVKLCN